MTTKRYYGWVPDRPDQRDYHFRSTLSVSALPKTMDLRAGMPPVYDQGQLGSCTANAIGAALDYQRKKQHEAFITPSRLFIYYNERAAEGTTSSDAGASIRDSVKAVVNYGAPQELKWPYVISRFATKPTASAYKAAVPFEAITYSSVQQNVAGIKKALVGNHPVVAGITVYDSFESDSAAATGKIPLPKPTESALGGHAIVVVGYTTSDWICRNSWGVDWGDKGYFYLPQKYLTDPSLSSDFWVLDTVK